MTRRVQPSVIAGCALALGAFVWKLVLLHFFSEALDDRVFFGILLLGAGIAFNREVDRLLISISSPIAALRGRLSTSTTKPEAPSHDGTVNPE